MIGLAFLNKHRRRLVAAGLALAIAAIVSGPAAAQQAPLKRFLALDPSGHLVWVYYADGLHTVTTPADMSKLSPDELRRARALLVGRGSGGRGTGRHYTTGGNRTGGTKTQTWHVGQNGSGPHGSGGRTTARTGRQNPFGK